MTTTASLTRKLFGSKRKHGLKDNRYLLHSIDSLNACEEKGTALEEVRANINQPSFEETVAAREIDVAFLSELLNSAIVQNLVAVQDTLEDSVSEDLEPVSCDNIELVKDVLDELSQSKATPAKELHKILTGHHFKAVIEAHDDIAAKNYEELPDSPLPMQGPPSAFVHPPDSVRMVGIRKNPDESLGITVKQEAGDMVIARILAGGACDSQGLLHVGDVIKEVNGVEVTEPDQLQDLLKKCNGSITLKILPSYVDPNVLSQVFVRAHFAFDPKKDNLIPCRDAGLPFKEGTILQIVNMEDTNWWQARKVDDNAPSGLIPSQTLEEKRKAFVKPDYDYAHKSLLCGIMTKKKRKLLYQSKKNAEYDKNDLLIYEEVARTPPFQRQLLVLIGAQGVGRRTLKQRLMKTDSSRFGSTIPHTSREMREGEVDGDGYWYVTRESMEIDIEENKYLEYGEFEGNLYGTKYDSIRRVIRSGRMCIVDANPQQALKSLKTSEFMPYVVFIAAPGIEIMRNMHEFARRKGLTDRTKTERDFRSTLEESARIERSYKHYFDMTIVNDNMDEAYNTLRKAIETFSTEPQWVPVSWVY